MILLPSKESLARGILSLWVLMSRLVLNIALEQTKLVSEEVLVLDKEVVLVLSKEVVSELEEEVMLVEMMLILDEEVVLIEVVIMLLVPLLLPSCEIFMIYLLF